jgi:hypothetical protein
LGKDNRSVNAFYFGNWLTDVFQTVDPVTYWSGSKKAKESVKNAIDLLIEEILPTIFPRLIKKELVNSLKTQIKKYVDKGKELINEKIDLLVSFQTNERDSNLVQFFRQSFLIIGYFKFVHPNSSDQKPRMNFECFMRVFSRSNDTRGASDSNLANDRPGAFTQYYPYHHLDRPEILPPKSPPIIKGSEFIVIPIVIVVMAVLYAKIGSGGM